MKLLKITVFSLVLLFLFSSIISYSQVKTTSSNWKSPTFTIEITGNYTQPLQESKGNIGEFFTFKNYGLKTGWGAAFNFKFGLGKQGQYRPYITLGYTQMQNKDDAVAYIDSNEIAHGYPLKGSQLYSSTPGKSTMFLRMPFFGAGFEYAFTNVDKKKRMWFPFIGVEFLMSVIAGTYRQTPNATPTGLFAGQEVTYTMKSDVRMGLGGTLGATVRFGKYAGIVFGGKYKIANLIGKKSDYLLEENKMNLLDKAATDLNSNLSKDRNIGYLEFFLGASIFLGKTKK